ncbi:hypothetical protein QE357_003022 [Siphonobacter sp. BAB-5404]|nr:hypothetical protein [Siphonobacter sp. SORGH_AS_0500]
MSILRSVSTLPKESLALIKPLVTQHLYWPGRI